LFPLGIGAASGNRTLSTQLGRLASDLRLRRI
jgi:hypothetical protein